MNGLGPLLKRPWREPHPSHQVRSMNWKVGHAKPRICTDLELLGLENFEKQVSGFHQSLVCDVLLQHPEKTKTDQHIGYLVGNSSAVSV